MCKCIQYVCVRVYAHVYVSLRLCGCGGGWVGGDGAGRAGGSEGGGGNPPYHRGERGGGHEHGIA